MRETASSGAFVADGRNRAAFVHLAQAGYRGPIGAHVPGIRALTDGHDAPPRLVARSKRSAAAESR